MSFKVSIYKVPYSACVSMMFVEERDGRLFIAKPVKLEWEETEGNCESSPTISFNWQMSDAVLKAMAEALDENGVKTDSDAKMKGTLEATRYHLEDLRNLLKLKGVAR